MEGYDNAAYCNLILRPDVFLIRKLVLSDTSCVYPFTDMLHVALLKHQKETKLQFERLRQFDGCGLIATKEPVFVFNPLRSSVRWLIIYTSVNFFRPNTTRVYVR